MPPEEDLITGLGVPEPVQAAGQDDLISGLGVEESPQDDLVTGLGTPESEDLITGLGTLEDRPRLDVNTIYDDPEMQQRSVRYYRSILGRDVTPREAIDRAFKTYRWSQANTAQNAIEAYRTPHLTDEQKEDFAFQRRTLESLPDVWQRGGGGWGATAELIGKGMADPVNAIGGGAVRLGAAALRGIAPRVAGWLGTTAGRISGTAAVDAAASATGNVLNQQVEKDVNMRDHISLGEAGLAGVVGAGLSGVGNVLTTRFGRTPGAAQSTGNPDIDPLLGKMGTNPNAGRDESIVGSIDRLNTKLYNANIPAAVVQESGPNAVGRDARSIVEAEKDAVRTGGIDVGDMPYIRAQLLPGSVARSEITLMNNTILPAEHGARAGTPEAGYGRVTGEGLQPILDAIDKADIPQDHLWLYADAMRAKLLRTARGTGGYFDDASVYMRPGVTRAQAEQMAADAPDRVIAWGNSIPGMRDAFDRLQGFFARTADYSVAGQVTNAEQLARMRATPAGVEFAYMPWMPAKNSANLLSSIASGKAPDATGSPIRRKLTGNMGNRMPGMDRVVSYVKRSVAAADRNLFNLSFVDHVLDAQTANAWDGKQVLRKLDGTAAQSALDIAKRDAEAALEKQGIANASADEIDLAAASILAERRGGVNLGGRQTITAFRNGVQEVYEVLDPEVSRMFGSMAPEEVGNINGWMRNFARWRSDVITGNPIFIGKDFVRNTISAGVNSQFAFKPVLSSLQGLVTLAKGSRLNPHDASRTATQAFLQEARASGLGYSGRRTTALVASAGGDISKYKSLSDYASKNMLSRGWQGWLAFGDQIEMASRITEYAMARKAGLSGPVAAHLGRQVATDFATRGADQRLRHAFGVTSFLNAALQGTNRTWRAMAHEKTKWQAAKVMALIVSPMVALHAYNGGQEAYDNLSPEQKGQGLWVSWPRNWEEMGDYLSGSKNGFTWSTTGNVQHRSPEVDLIPIPIPQEFAAIGAVFNGILEAIRASDPTKGVEGFYRGIMGAIPGIHAPDAVQPAIEIALNRDGLGRDIRPPQLEGASGVDQAKPSTAEWAVGMGRIQEKLTRWFHGEDREGWVALTPIEIEHIGKHIMPGIAGLVLQTMGQLGRNEGTRGPAPAGRNEDFDIRDPQSAVLRGFVGRSGEGQDAAVGELYDLADRAERAAKANRSAMMNPRSRGEYGSQDLSGERRLLQSLGTSFRSNVEAMRKLTQTAAEIESSPSITDPAEKRRRLDIINAQRNDLARRTMAPLKKSPSFAVLFQTRLNPNPAENTGDRNLARDFLRARTPPNGPP